LNKPVSEEAHATARRKGSSSDELPERRVPILALLSANAVSVVGNAMSAVAIPWFVLRTTDSAIRTGITGAVGALGAVLAAFFGGPIVDRLGFKRTSVAADLVSAATTAFIPLLFATGYLTFWLLLVLVFLGAVLDAPGMSARQAMIPELARSARMTTEGANSADSAVPRLAQFLGPPLAGVLITAFGAIGVLWLNAATFVLSAALVAAAIPTARSSAIGEPPTEGTRGYLDELLEGFEVRLDQSAAPVPGVLDDGRELPGRTATGGRPARVC
jgi:MFS family permease